MHARRPRQIRQFVQSQISNLSPTCGPILDETLLIRDGQYCGHRYQTEELTAVWFLEEDEIKIYDHAGHVIGVVCPGDFDVRHNSDAA